MPLSDELKKKVEELSKLNNRTGHDEIFKLLIDAISSGKTTPKDIHDYSTHHWENPHRFVIEATNLNALGVFLSQSENPEFKKFSVLFYNISADRDCSWGCHNFAQRLIMGLEFQNVTGSKEAGLKYAQKAVTLTKATSTPHLHKLELARALRANGLTKESNIALTEYLDFRIKQYGTSFSKDWTISGFQFLEQIINELNPVETITKEIAQTKIDQIELFLEKRFSCQMDKEIQSKISYIMQQLSFLHGFYLEVLGKASDAMLAYCRVDDITSIYYQQAVKARAKLLKETVSNMLSAVRQIAPSDGVTPITIHLSTTTINESMYKNTSLVTNALLEQSSYARYWKKGTDSFDFVMQTKQAKDYEEKIAEINTLLEAKKIEIRLLQIKLNQLTKNSSNVKEELPIIGQLKNELGTLEIKLSELEQAKKIVESDYLLHEPLQRQLIRRNKSEAQFFNPARLKNKEAIINLAHRIIDQRFGLISVTHPVELTGIPVRIFAAAEKAFQNAIIYLTGESNPRTGIPIVRKGEWSFEFASGSNNFGPKENYKIGETPIIFEHRENPKTQRLGDSFSPQHKTYDSDIYPFLSSLTQGELEKEKTVARLLINYGKRQQPVTLEALQCLDSNADNDRCNKFNQVCALIMAKEQVQWLSATVQSFCGLTVIHARCLLLLEKGLLTLEEVFKNNGLFSVYSNTNIINNSERLQTACNRIDTLYIEYLKSLNLEAHCRMFRLEIKNNEKVSIVATKKQALKDLRAVYGGSEESDGEGYDSDLRVFI